MNSDEPTPPPPWWPMWVLIALIAATALYPLVIDRWIVP